MEYYIEHGSIFESENFELYIYKDLDADSPIEDKNFFGIISCIYKDKYIGHDHDFKTLEEIKEYIEDNGFISLPIYLKEDFSINITTENKRGYRQVGYIYVSYKEKIKENFSKNLYDALRDSVEKYNYYLNGQVYAYSLNYKAKYTSTFINRNNIKEWIKEVYNTEIEDKITLSKKILINTKGGFYGQGISENGMLRELPVELIGEIYENTKQKKEMQKN